MSVKSDVLKYLEKNIGETVSGQELAEKLGVSRNSVWKAINSLKAQGCEISSSTKTGYCLKDYGNILSPEAIVSYLPNEFSNLQIKYFESIDSTNNQAKRMAADGFKGSALIVANEQTAGRGRMGRSFYSPCSTGVYFSILITPENNFGDAVSVTTAAAVAVVKAIESVSQAKPLIKWVNDVYLNGKKVCGILTEATTDFETGKVASIVIGIGINISTEVFFFFFLSI